jgi:ppGpp synthetase/RelA/SpoT-type nucleotidyltranferase
MTKGELNRLGDRLRVSDKISEADLTELALVLSSYQEVLDGVKRQLKSLGFSATGRVKTTGTLTDKLRRIHNFELSRMQDLAGARITVSDINAQDMAAEKIQAFYVEQGCACKLVDRRADPRFGYREVHLVIRIDELPVEIQIRTEIQDSWAQIVERLGDRWGRSIRYGGDPESPDSLIRSGDLVMSRRGVMDMLMDLSKASALLERARTSVAENERALASIKPMIAEARQRANRERLANKISPEMEPIRDRLTKILSRSTDPDDKAFLAAGPDMTGAQLTELAERSGGVLIRQTQERAVQVQESEQALRVILQLIADATDEGE